MENMTKTKAETVLQDIYKNVTMARESLLNLMPKVNDERLKSDLTVQISVYEAFASRAAKQLAAVGIKPEEEGIVTKMSAKWGSMLNTLRDSSSSHLAEMVIEGATMGVNDMYKQIRESDKAELPREVQRLAQDICDFEEKTVHDMKEYLK